MATQVHLEDEVELLVGHVEQHLVAGDAGVVDHDVEPAELVDGGLEHRLGGGALPHVAGHDERLDPDGADLLGRLLRCAGEVVEHDVGAGVGQREGLGPAEPGACTGDDGDPALEGQRVGWW